MNGKQQHKTKVVKKSLNPDFDEGLDLQVYSRIRTTVIFEIRDFNQFSQHVTIGTAFLELGKIAVDEMQVLDLPIHGGTGSLTLRFMFVEKALQMNLSPLSVHDSRLETEQTTLGKFGKGLLKMGTKTKIEMSSMLGDSFKTTKKDSPRSSMMDIKKAEEVEIENSKKESVAENAGIEKKDIEIPPSNHKVSVLDDGSSYSLQQSSQSRRTLKDVQASSRSLDVAREEGHSRASTTMSHLEGNTQIKVSILGARNLKPVDAGGTSDPFVRATLQGTDKKVHKTAIIKKNLNPSWPGEEFFVTWDGPAVKFSVMDKNIITQAVALGHIVLDLTSLIGDGEFIDDWYKIQNGSGDLHIKALKTQLDVSMASEDSKKTLKSKRSLLRF
jgi:Ca2+-dependent lipid-binding protein